MVDTTTYIPSKEDDFDSPGSFLTDRASNAALPQISQMRVELPVPDSVPIAIFNQGLSGLEAITFHLKERHHLRFCEIAALLNRDDRTIWDAYSEGRKKAQVDSLLASSPVLVPLSIFQDRRVGVLEALSEYLKDSKGMRHCQIASLLGKNDRTIWTAYTRAKKKRILHAS